MVSVDYFSLKSLAVSTRFDELIQSMQGLQDVGVLYAGDVMMGK